MSNKTDGISMTVFIVGIVIAILAASALSFVIVNQFSDPLQGEPGPQGPVGPEGGFGAPDFDSSWRVISQSENYYLEHNLGEDQNLFVYLYGKDQSGQIHQQYLGTDGHNELDIDHTRGAYWKTSDSNNLIIHREAQDSLWVEFRALIWIIS